MRWSDSHGCWRATASDAYYGPSCPICAGPKDDQALLCRSCRAEERRLDDFWERRTCSCGSPKSATREKCWPCETERRRREPQPRDGDGLFVRAS